MYTDFIVREIDEFGNVAKLTNISHHNIGITKYIRIIETKVEKDLKELSLEGISSLSNYLDEEDYNQFLRFYTDENILQINIKQESKEIRTKVYMLLLRNILDTSNCKI